MSPNINNLIATINKLGGLNSGNKYTVQITPPASLNVDSRTLVFLCDTVTLPAHNISLEQVRYKGYGLSEQRANGVQFDDIQCTFYVDNSNVALGFFQKWIQLISSVDPNHADKTFNGVPSEMFSYPEEYWGEITIDVQDKASNSVIKYQVSKAFPHSIGSIQLSWDQNDQISRLPISFTYRSYSTTVTENLPTKTFQSQIVPTNNNNFAPLT